MKDELWDEIESLPGKTEWEIEKEFLLQKAREKYHLEHGRWPEEDGVVIIICK